MSILSRSTTLIAALGLVLFSSNALAQTSYAYCSAGERDYGRVYYISTVFKVQRGIYHVGVQNSFNSHLDARAAKNLAGASCGVSYDSYQEAEDNRNDWIARLRRNGTTVHSVPWSYRGD